MSDIKEIKLNDILEAQWGYEQTNVDFYQVVKVYPNGFYITVQAIESEDADYHDLTGHKIPLPGKFKADKPFRRKINWYFKDDPSIKINPYTYGHLWNGRPVFFSEYA